MKKVIEIIKKNRWIHYLIIIAIGLLVSIPLLYMQITAEHDGFIHVTRLIGLDNSIKESQFPFLIAPYLCRNFGYSMTSFYPPFVTYVPYVLGVIANSFSIGLKFFAALTIILSGIFMYNFVQEVTKKRAISLLASIFYMVFPYHFEVIYTRFAIGEFTAMVFLPIVFQGLYNLINGDGKRHYYIAIGAIRFVIITYNYNYLCCFILHDICFNTY